MCRSRARGRRCQRRTERPHRCDPGSLRRRRRSCDLRQAAAARHHLVLALFLHADDSDGGRVGLSRLRTDAVERRHGPVEHSGGDRPAAGKGAEGRGAGAGGEGKARRPQRRADRHLVGRYKEFLAREIVQWGQAAKAAKVQLDSTETGMSTEPLPSASSVASLLETITSATLTTVLLKKGLRNVWIRGTRPLAAGPAAAGRPRLHASLRADA